MGNESSKPDGAHEELASQMKTQVGRIKAIVGGKARDKGHGHATATHQVKASAADYEFIRVSAVDDADAAGAISRRMLSSANIGGFCPLQASLSNLLLFTKLDKFTQQKVCCLIVPESRAETQIR